MTSDRYAVSARPARVLAMRPLHLLALGLLASPGAAGGTPQAPSRLECSGGVPGCRTVQGAATAVPADSEVQVTITCPKDARFFWNWSAEPGRHVQVQFVAAVLNQARQAIGATFAVQAQSERNPARPASHWAAPVSCRAHAVPTASSTRPWAGILTSNTVWGPWPRCRIEGIDNHDQHRTSAASRIAVAARRSAVCSFWAAPPRPAKADPCQDERQRRVSAPVRKDNLQQRALDSMTIRKESRSIVLPMHPIIGAAGATPSAASGTSSPKTCLPRKPPTATSRSAAPRPRARSATA